MGKLFDQLDITFWVPLMPHKEAVARAERWLPHVEAMSSVVDNVAVCLPAWARWQAPFIGEPVVTRWHNAVRNAGMKLYHGRNVFDHTGHYQHADAWLDADTYVTAAAAVRAEACGLHAYACFLDGEPYGQCKFRDTMKGDLPWEQWVRLNNAILPSVESVDWVTPCMSRSQVRMRDWKAAIGNLGKSGWNQIFYKMRPDQYNGNPPSTLPPERERATFHGLGVWLTSETDRDAADGRWGVSELLDYDVDLVVSMGARQLLLYVDHNERNDKMPDVMDALGRLKGGDA